MPKTYNKELYKDDTWQWQEGDLTATRTNFWSGPGCHEGCGVIVYTKDDKVVKMEGDPNNPFNQGRLCMRCMNVVEEMYHPDRLKWPLKRVGERGENKWERISWDQAYDIIVDEVHKIWENYAPEAIVSMIGTGRNANLQAPLLSYWGFGSPNFALGFLSGDSCMLPRMSLTAIANGAPVIADMSQARETRYEDDPEWVRPEVIVIWANNPVVSNSDCFLGHWLVESMKRGSRLIVIDPKLTWMAARASIWLRVRPGTDAALALAMIHVIIQEDLYDHEFVENWTHGFDELATRAAEYPVEKVAEICWLEPEKIYAAARMYAKAKPGCMQWGLPLDQSRIGIPAAHAVHCLVGLTGNIDNPGGNILTWQAFDTDLGYTAGLADLPPEVRAKRIGDDVSPMHMYSQAASAFGDLILKAMETDDPYPIRMLWLQSTNPIVNMGAEAPRIYKAMRRMDFVVVVDLFMTPTATACADIVLPCAMSPERNSLRGWFEPLRCYSRLASYYEAKSDETIILELGKRLKPENWPFKDDIELLNFMLDRSQYGKKFDDIEKNVYEYTGFNYLKHEKGLNRPDGQPGFNTPTGKFELYLTLLDSFGEEPLPYYEEPPESPYSRPDLFADYPLVLTTGARNWGYFHSEHRQYSQMRVFRPDPMVTMNPETGAKYGIQEGDWIWIENMRGRCRQKVMFDVTYDPRVIAADHGWWFPEKEGAEPILYGCFDSNINNLTPQFQYGATGYGAPYKCQICRIYKCTEENSKILPTEQVTRLGGFKYDRV